MKRTIALFGSLLVFAGLKAQTPPIVKKETVKPVLTKPAPADSLNAIKQTTKSIKYDHIKKTNPMQMKESPAVAKPHKG